MFVWNLFEWSINLLQGLMMLLFMKSRLHIRRTIPVADALCALTVAVFLALYDFVEMPVPDIIVFVIPLVYGLVMTEDPWYMAVFWSLMLGLIFAVSTSLMMHLCTSIPGISDAVLIADTRGHLFFVLATNAVLFLLLYAVGRIHVGDSIPMWSLLLLVAMNGALFAAEEAVYALQLQLTLSALVIKPHKTIFFTIYLCMLICVALSILLFRMMAENAERENRYKLEASTLALSQQHVRELERMYADYQAHRHDLKQHVQTLEEMVSMGGGEEAATYLASYQKRLVESELFMTGCIAVDALLTAKYLTMRKHGMTFTYSAYPLNELPIDETDFCSIVGNLLDNAIEGTLRVQPLEAALPIHLTFSRSWDMFYIFCTNSCNPQTIQRGKHGWQSSKERDGSPHAIGIRSITSIAEAVEGRCAFSVQDSVFHAKVVLPCAGAETHKQPCVVNNKSKM